MWDTHKPTRDMLFKTMRDMLFVKARCSVRNFLQSYNDHMSTVFKQYFLSFFGCKISERLAMNEGECIVINSMEIKKQASNRSHS